MIFHLILNSLIVFLVLTIGVEICLSLFRIQQPRVRYFCRLIPLLKIPFDLLFFSFFDDPLFFNLNPFSCEIYTQNFVKTLFQISPSQTIPAFIANIFPPIYMQIFTVAAVVGACTLLGWRIVRLAASKHYLHDVLLSSTMCSRPIGNPKISDQITSRGVKIYTSGKIETPFAASGHMILLPQDLLNELTQEEFEAVIAHELEHLSWKDPWIRFTANLLCSFLWWLPSSWWMKRLEEDQELASDKGIRKYAIDPVALSSAFVKTIRKNRTPRVKSAAICPFVSPLKTHPMRLKNMLNTEEEKLSLASLIGVGCCLILFLSFWMC